MSITKQSSFLSAEWRKLAIANYIVDPAILLPYLPRHTELDLWKGNCYVSLIGFMFLKTKLKSIRIPFHSNFEEVNLRFYVRFNDNGTWKRGVTFIKEIVPKPALTLVANTIYGEKYETLPMKHDWSVDEKIIHVRYQWKKEKWNSISIEAGNTLLRISPGSDEDFITEHYWGYTRLNENQTSEYEVRHPTWSTYDLKGYNIEVDFAKCYGKEFGFLSDRNPDSVMLAEGSEIEVMSGRKI